MARVMPSTNKYSPSSPKYIRSGSPPKCSSSASFIWLPTPGRVDSHSQ